MSTKTHGGARSLPRQVGRSLFAAALGVPHVGRGAAAAGDRGTQRAAEEHGVPAALHAGALRDDREGRREPLSLAHPPLQAEAVQARLCGAGHRLSVLEGSLGRAAARGRGARRRAHLRRQPLQPEDRPAQRRGAGPGEGRPRHRVPDRRARRGDRRREVSRRGYSAHRPRGAASRRDLLRREQLRGGLDRRPAPRPLGQAVLARRGRRDRHDRARARRQPPQDASDRACWSG